MNVRVLLAISDLLISDLVRHRLFGHDLILAALR